MMLLQIQETIGDTLDDAMAEEGSEAEEEKIVSQVLDELGVGLGESLPDAAAAKPQEEKAAEEDPAMSELEARLNNLKRS